MVRRETLGGYFNSCTLYGPHFVGGSAEFKLSPGAGVNLIKASALTTGAAIHSASTAGVGLASGPVVPISGAVCISLPGTQFSGLFHIVSDLPVEYDGIIDPLSVQTA